MQNELNRDVRAEFQRTALNDQADALSATLKLVLSGGGSEGTTPATSQDGVKRPEIKAATLEIPKKLGEELTPRDRLRAWRAYREEIRTSMIENQPR